MESTQKPDDKPFAIEFVRPWRGRQIGQIARLMRPGLALTLIRHGFAKRLEPPKPRRGRPPKPKPVDE